MGNYRLEGLFTLRAPLSHIGETISSTSYLVEETILQPDGAPEKVFVYSGNAWRGQLRDLMASYMLDAIKSPSITVDAFHLLFSGGRIGGPQSIDLDKARRLRATIPMLALLGGGIGNQIVSGKLRVGNCYPLCVEALPVLPLWCQTQASAISYADITQAKEFSRRDDSKIEAIARYLPAPSALALQGGKPAKSRREDGPADQMRIRSELVVAGTKLRTWIAAPEVSEVELGCLVSALYRFAMAPFIGGQSARGHGLVDLEYRLRDLNAGTEVSFIQVREDDGALLSNTAQSAKATYDAHLRGLYDDLLNATAGTIANLLGAA